MNKTEFKELWTLFQEDREREQLWYGMGLLIVLIGIPLAIIFLPTIAAVPVATLLSFVGMGTSGAGAHSDQYYEQLFTKLQEQYAVTEAADRNEIAVLDQRTGDRS